MSRLFSTYGSCARSSRLAVREWSLLTKHGAGGRVGRQLSDTATSLLQQQRRYFGRSSAVFVRRWPRSGLWLCGLGVGVALAVGLKCRFNAASVICDNIKSERLSERYSDAIQVSRDLVERIKVREVVVAVARSQGSEVRG